jgi:hypothetical protein
MNNNGKSPAVVNVIANVENKEVYYNKKSTTAGQVNCGHERAMQPLARLLPSEHTQKDWETMQPRIGGIKKLRGS